jgi:hypothetical protein
LDGRTKKISIAAWCIVFLAGVALLPRAGAQEDIAVIVSLQNPAAGMSLADLRKIFAGDKRTWPGGLSIKLIVRGPGCHERLAMLKLLKMSESDYKSHWTAEVFRGEADSEPISVPSVGMQREAIVAFPGSITLVEAKSVKPGMKVIKLDGLLPGVPGYPLQ